MELTQQVKNYEMTTTFSKKNKPSLKKEDKDPLTHEKALQALANGANVPYQATMRTVVHEGNRGPRLPPRVTQKHTGYIRNESGGAFTS
ncbi:flagellar associated protein [Dunaliella salina]|uniref:Flagellar associated protein n=1 Tax=Dunaliella salina TaxID=3046 RepID=A0ABQ7GDH9_DUNSA|nr:flagellar associated protein [Dunaliella salina]|mmetsp:Transcript_12631/g.34510  ORF Transcript_12631/g.34510 Transcript_12631/m.34510 type:complete len:89 (+) Transcript_12631:95-361(+)|eukprot:KAF5832670.1 flagellar associated protein [Dunaliella salina]